MAIVQAHQGSTIRKKVKEKRTVYKSVLDSPFILKWPSVVPELGARILGQLVAAITPVGDYRRACKKKRPSQESTAPQQQQQDQAMKPEIFPRVHAGINQVTRFLENHIKSGTKASYTPVVFVCKREIKPLHLCNHLLSMAASARVKLVQLPLTAEMQLANALGLQRACALVLEITETEEALRLSVQEVQDVKAPWLTASSPTYQSTHVKILQSSAPTK